VAPDLSSLSNVSAYINISKVMNKVKRMFKAWFDNLQFFHYLERIGRIISVLPVTVMQIPGLSLAYPASTPPKRLDHIAQQDLFSGDGPDVYDNSASTTGLDLLVSLSNPSSSDTRLDTLVANLQAAAADSKYEKAYVADLDNSVQELQKSRKEFGLIQHTSFQQNLTSHLEACRKRVDLVYGTIVSAVSPGSSVSNSSPGLNRAAALWSVKH